MANAYSTKRHLVAKVEPAFERAILLLVAADIGLGALGASLHSQMGIVSTLAAILVLAGAACAVKKYPPEDIVAHILVYACSLIVALGIGIPTISF